MLQHTSLLLAQGFFQVHKVVDHTVNLFNNWTLFSWFASDKFPNVLCRPKDKRSTNARTGRGLSPPSSSADCGLRKNENQGSSLFFFCWGFWEHYINSALHIYSWFLSCSFNSANIINRSICTNLNFNKTMWLGIISEDYRYTFQFKVKESISYH